MIAEVINIPDISGGFQEDKDLAREIRNGRILPALQEGHSIVIDFSDVRYTTQSFVHALIGAALKQYGEDVLDRMEFRHCSPQLQNLISLVVDYTLGGFVMEPEPSQPVASNAS
jgi:hypothetical protein